MTKDEIAQNNLEIARLVYPECRVEGINYTKTDSIAVFAKDVNLDSWDFLGEFDYYNNWGDLMPLVENYTSKVQVNKRTSYYLIRMVTRDNSEAFVVKSGILKHALANCLLEVLRHKAKEKGDE